MWGSCDHEDILFSNNNTPAHAYIIWKRKTRRRPGWKALDYWSYFLRAQRKERKQQIFCRFATKELATRPTDWYLKIIMPASSGVELTWGSLLIVGYFLFMVGVKCWSIVVDVVGSRRWKLDENSPQWNPPKSIGWLAGWLVLSVGCCQSDVALRRLLCDAGTSQTGAPGASPTQGFCYLAATNWFIPALLAGCTKRRECVNPPWLVFMCILERFWYMFMRLPPNNITTSLFSSSSSSSLVSLVWTVLWKRQQINFFSERAIVCLDCCCRHSPCEDWQDEFVDGLVGSQSLSIDSVSIFCKASWQTKNENIMTTSNYRAT